MSVEDVLRDTLRAAPEPPDGLGAAHTARRRAKAIKRRRYAAATSAVTCVAVVLAGVALVAPSRRAADVTPVGPPPAGAYPDWPRRGNAPATRDAKAVEAYHTYLADPADVRAETATATRPPRVLYADQREGKTVVVLHAVADTGGERLVVVTGDAGGELSVYADYVAPEPGTEVVTVLLDREEMTPGNVCDRGDASPLARLLVLTAPGLERDLTVEGRAREDCADRSVWAQGELRTTGSAVLTLAVPPRAVVRVEVREGGLVYQQDRPYHGSYGIGRGALLTGAVPWTERSDNSRADALRDALTRSDALQRRYGRQDCVVSASLPDGTPFALCALNDGPQPVVLLVAEARDRKNRVYLEIPPDPLPTAFTAVVDGLTGRWLLVVGDEGLAAAELRTADGTQQVPMQQGVGWLRLDREPPDDARVWTPGYGADGGMAIMDRTGEVIDLR